MHRLLTSLVSVAVVGLLPTVLAGQMSGNYTIDPAGSGARNFPSIQSAVYRLWNQGMSGAVTFTVAPGTYQENVTLVPISGMSAATPLTFRSKERRQAILSPGGGTIWRTVLSTVAQPIRGLVVDGFDLRDAARAFDAQSPLADFEFVNCFVRDSVRESGLTGTATRWRIHHCTFESQQTCSSGCYFPPTMVLRECDAVAIHHNEFSGRAAPLTIESTSTSPNAAATRIYNNVFRAICYPYALRLGALAFGVDVVHNSFLNGEQQAACIRISGSFTAPHRVLNNVFVQGGSGTRLVPPVFVDSVSAYDYEMDGNIFFGGPGVVKLYHSRGTGREFPTLASWQQATGQDQNSQRVDPQFVSNIDLRLQRGSPAVDRALNTPSYVTDDFEGRSRGSKPDVGAFELHIPFMRFGAGCAGTFGHVPTLTHTGRPGIGSNDLKIVLGKALGGSRGAFFTIGISKTIWNGIPLPLAFGGGCNLLVSADLIVPVGVTGPVGPGTGSAQIGIPIPNDPGLIGSVAHFQWGVQDPAAAGIGVAFSNAATLSL